jgi:hypothetical protein
MGAGVWAFSGWVLVVHPESKSIEQQLLGVEPDDCGDGKCLQLAGYRSSTTTVANSDPCP